MLCCPDPTILSQLQLRPQVPLALMLSVCSMKLAGISSASHMTTSPSHYFLQRGSIALKHGMLPLYWEPQVACNLYGVTLCIQYFLYGVTLCITLYYTWAPQEACNLYGVILCITLYYTWAPQEACNLYGVTLCITLYYNVQIVLLCNNAQ